jgi:murein DD-endopeptidase MepM/ murein hydrolase activator NlpD
MIGSMFRWLLKFLVFVLVLAAIGASAAYYLAGRGAPPALVIDRPDRVAGQTGTLEVTAGAPNAVFTDLTIALEQNGRELALFSLGDPAAATVTKADDHRLKITRPFGRQSIPELRQGPARIVVRATRPSVFNLRMLSAEASKDIQIKLEPPSLFVMSTHHYVNHGGSELVVYRVAPPESQSGVRVGTLEYPGYPVPGAPDPSLRMAFFALLHEQERSTPIAAFARDEVGNETRASFVNNVFPKPFRRSRIALDDRFLQRVVPEILLRSPELTASATDLLPAFLKINGDLRKINADEISKITATTSTSRLWDGPFVQLGNSSVEASFADHRTYLYGSKEVDQQVHLGFDLAVTAAVPVVAANAGAVLHAAWLGIYGNCVILDHGMGVASLYGHLSSVEVKPGETVKKGQVLGRSGMTGLAGGDHLHFTMLVQGRPVNPVEWWDPHWIEDRVDRKLKTLGNTAR